MFTLTFIGTTAPGMLIIGTPLTAADGHRSRSLSAAAPKHHVNSRRCSVEWVQQHACRRPCDHRWSAHEALRGPSVRGAQSFLAPLSDTLDMATEDLFGSEECEALVVMGVVVPSEEC